MSDGALLRSRVGYVEFVTLDNPPFNVITMPMRRQFIAAIDAFRNDNDLRAIVIHGAGDRAFCAGADLKRYGDDNHPFSDIDGVLRYDEELHGAWERLPMPTIAAINGHCIGGGLELALCCDIRIASTEARLRSPGVRMGMLANTTRLTTLFGPAIARDLVMTGRTMTGDEAAARGIVSRVVPPVELLTAATEIAEMIASRAPLSTRAAKEAIGCAVAMTKPEALRRQYELYLQLLKTDDHQAAVEAFFHKREPVFRGR